MDENCELNGFGHLFNKRWTLFNLLLTFRVFFHTVHGVLKARILKWFAIPFSSGPHFVKSLHHDLPVLGCPTGMT